MPDMFYRKYLLQNLLYLYYRVSRLRGTTVISYHYFMRSNALLSQTQQAKPKGFGTVISGYDCCYLHVTYLFSPLFIVIKCKLGWMLKEAIPSWIPQRLRRYPHLIKSLSRDATTNSMLSRMIRTPDERSGNDALKPHGYAFISEHCEFIGTVVFFYGEMFSDGCRY
jgi:hypothetical protein